MIRSCDKGGMDTLYSDRDATPGTQFLLQKLKGGEEPLNIERKKIK